MTDKYCPLRFREFGSQPHDQRCIGESCAWFDKCSQSHGEPIYGSVCDAANGIDGETNGIADDSPLVDEPPDGDVVAILRKYANFWSLSHETHTQCDSDWEVTTMMALADMIERDYVSREKHDEAMRLKLIDIGVQRAMCNQLEAERDELKRQLDTMRDVARDFRGERDEWKARVDELEKRLAGNARHPFTETILASLDSRENELKLQEKVDELTKERDYWKQEVQYCMDAAYPKIHSPERRYDPNVMAYPDRKGCTTPSTLVCDIIDGLRDEKGEMYMGLVKELTDIKDENAKLSSDELHWHSEADFWKRKYELIAKAVNDVARNYVDVEDEGVA